MKKKVIALIIAIPLILMFSIFSVANVASLAVAIPVNGVVITVDGVEMSGDIYYWNIADNEELTVGAYVLPLRAAKQEVSFYTKNIEGKSSDGITIDSNSGVITATNVGSVLVVARSIDGGREDSFILVAWSSLITSLEIIGAFIEDSLVDTINQNDRFIMKAEYLPDTDIEDTTISWSSSDTSIVTINEYSGNARAHSQGEVVITATMNGLNGVISASYSLTVNAISSPSGIITSGGQNTIEYALSNSFEFFVEINYNEIESSLTDFDNNNPFVFDYLHTVNAVLLDSSTDTVLKYKVTTTLIEDNATLKMRINDSFYSFEDEAKYSVISLVKMSANDFDYDILLSNTLFKGSTRIVPIEITPEVSSDIMNGLGLSYEISADNACLTINGLSSITSTSMSYAIKAWETGSVTLTLKVFADGILIDTIIKNINVVAPYASLNFAENSKKWGIANLLAYAKQTISDGDYITSGYKLDLRGRLSGSPTGKVVDYIENIEFVVSDTDIADIVDGELVVEAEGIVTITATSGSASASITVRCVDGVNIYTYEELVKATEDGKKIVIQDNIYLGRELYRYTRDDSGKIVGVESLLAQGESAADILMSQIKLMNTTADDTFYKNRGIEAPKIKYCIEFSNDVYGNGYFINGQNITYMLDATNALRSSAVFRGPLDMVAMEGAAVKAQDNIVFVIRNNVRIDNVELKGADDVDDLTKLNYVGTTVEVMGDNVIISNTRINNGRTVLRIFGDEDKDKQINVKIASSILSHAREFIVKIGTNKYILGEQTSTEYPQYEQCAPKLGDYNHFDKEANLNNPEFINEYVKTIVTMENSVLYNSGLFAVGLESKFAGPCLDGYPYGSHNFAQLGWKGIAGTSYAAILKLSGDVRIYDWKNINYVDSSTLIEGDTIKFDVKSMIELIGETYPDLMVKDGIDYYAHGGISLYGGGKNYSIVDTSNFLGIELSKHTVGFEDLGEGWESRLLPYAAGKEPFQFYMYDNGTESFTYLRQRDDMHSGEWIDWMPIYTE